MPTMFPDVQDATLQKLCDAVVTSVRRNDGSIPAAFTDRLYVPVTTSVPAGSQATPGREVAIEFRVNPDGLSAFAKVRVATARGVYSIEGAIDPSLLATKLV